MYFQWGFINSLRDFIATVSFPIAFTTLFSVVGIGLVPEYEDHYNDYMYGYSNNNFKWRGCGSQRAFWLAVGK